MGCAARTVPIATPIWLGMLSAVILGLPLPAMAQGGGAPPSVEIHVLDPGLEPRRLLRYAWVAGHTETAAAVSSTHLLMSFDGEVVADVEMPISVTLDLTIADVSVDGTATVSLAFLDIAAPVLLARGATEPRGEVEQMLVDSFELVGTVFESLEGATGRMVVDDRGTTLSLEIDYPEGFPVAMMAQLWMIATEPLPEPPVGNGARWEAAFAREAVAGVLSEDLVVSHVVALGEAGFELEKSWRGTVTTEPTAEAESTTPTVGTIEGDGASSVDLSRLTSNVTFRYVIRAETRDVAEVDGQEVVTVGGTTLTVTATQEVLE